MTSSIPSGVWKDSSVQDVCGFVRNETLPAPGFWGRFLVVETLNNETVVMFWPKTSQRHFLWDGWITVYNYSSGGFSDTSKPLTEVMVLFQLLSLSWIWTCKFTVFRVLMPKTYLCILTLFGSKKCHFFLQEWKGPVLWPKWPVKKYSGAEGIVFLAMKSW